MRYENTAIAEQIIDELGKAQRELDSLTSSLEGAHKVTANYLNRRIAHVNGQILGLDKSYDIVSND